MYLNSMREIRKNKNITLFELSEITGISVGYLCHLERGTRNNPSIEIMNKIAKALDESVGKIFFME